MIWEQFIKVGREYFKLFDMVWEYSWWTKTLMILMGLFSFYLALRNYEGVNI